MKKLTTLAAILVCLGLPAQNEPSVGQARDTSA